MGKYLAAELKEQLGLQFTNEMKLSIASSTNIDFLGLHMTTIQCSDHD